jgi:hypothetical protein
LPYKDKNIRCIFTQPLTSSPEGGSYAHKIAEEKAWRWNKDFYEKIVIPGAAYPAVIHNSKRMEAAPSGYLGTKYEIGYF